jgi:ribosomal protein S18 acetylase RimI-like enzyme
MAFDVRTGEVDLAIAIMQEVAQWCIDTGKPLWALAELTRAELLQEPRNEQSFVVARADGLPAATMILQWHDPLFWPHVEENKSGFLHKLCVRRAFAGRSLSRAMVEHAKSECRKRGIQYLRLDTDSTRRRLCQLYEGMGFRKAGRRSLDGRNYALYELKIREK